jgi:hypothetical protein
MEEIYYNVIEIPSTIRGETSMKEILYKYRERLINLSGRNRSLVSMTLPKKRAFDILKLSETKEGIGGEILKVRLIG